MNTSTGYQNSNSTQGSRVRSSCAIMGAGDERVVTVGVDCPRCGKSRERFGPGPHGAAAATSFRVMVEQKHTGHTIR